MNKVESMQKAISNFNYPCELYVAEIRALLELPGSYEMINAALKYGFIRGMRYMKAQQRKAGAINE